MGKRQFRILQKDLLPKQGEMIGRKGHVIQTDHVVVHGRILDIYPGAINVENARSGLHHIPMATVFEVVYDQETEY